MIKPHELASEMPYGPWSSRGCDVWDTFSAAAAGDAEALRRLLERDPNLYRAEYWYARPIDFAVREGHLESVRVLLDAGADPADAGLIGEGGALAAACTQGKRDLLVRLLEAGARVPAVVTGCRSYLVSDPGMLRLLLDSGMNPDLPNWQRATPLHDLCGRDRRGRPLPHREECAVILLEAGATISARDEDYRSTPLAWAARNDLPEMVDLLLARSAPTSLPDDAPWATPLAWATRRGHARIADILRRAGATA